jgi:DNA-binding response OmpR family regulator
MTNDSAPDSSVDTPVPKPRILLLEDDTLLASTLTRLLRRHGFAVTAVGRQSELSSLTGWFDLGIFDINLPEKSGLIVAFDCISDGVLEQVVFFSATQDQREIAAAKQLGQFVAKSDGFTAVIDRALEISKRISGVYQSSGDHIAAESSAQHRS